MLFFGYIFGGFLFLGNTLSLLLNAHDARGANDKNWLYLLPRLCFAVIR
jgi:hypothetical protein